MQTADRLSGSGSGTAGADVNVADLDNNALIIRLHFTINHLSRWLTPVHDRSKLARSVSRGEPSVKDLLLQMRDEELRVFPKLHLIAHRNNPDLDKLPEVTRTPAQQQWDQQANALEIIAEFRRLRQSTCSLLRSLPDSAWSRVGTSRREHDWQLRTLAEHLADHDREVLARIDRALDRVGAREGVSPAARSHLDELLRLAPAGREG
ncbi:MAG: hypothetical protein ACRDJW_23680 [Thermomicrobiales bacterium]